MKRAPGKAAMALAVVLGAIFAACEVPLLAGGSSSTETGKKVLYVGRVANAAGEGLEGVVVTLEGSSLRDTTDASGVYELSGRAKGRRVLNYALHGQVLTRKPMPVTTADIAEMRFSQRSFSGKLRASGFVRVEGVITGGSLAPGDSARAPFHYNALDDAYSGFMYFPVPDTASRPWAVRVDVLDSLGARIDYSLTVEFPSYAGNVVIPEFTVHKDASSP